MYIEHEELYLILVICLTGLTGRCSVQLSSQNIGPQ